MVAHKMMELFRRRVPMHADLHCIPRTMESDSKQDLMRASD